MPKTHILSLGFTLLPVPLLHGGGFHPVVTPACTRVTDEGRSESRRGGTSRTKEEAQNSHLEFRPPPTRSAPPSGWPGRRGGGGAPKPHGSRAHFKGNDAWRLPALGLAPTSLS